MRTRLLLTLLAGACLAPRQGVLAAEQVAPAAAKPPTVSGVTVTAPKPLGEAPKLRPQLEGFVRTYGAPAPIGQLGRWSEKVCPAVSGLSAQDNQRVAGRITALAAEVGAPVASATPCRRTVSVFFADQPQQVLDVIRTRAPTFLGYHYPAQTRRVATFSGVIRAWYTTATGGASGGGYEAATHGVSGELRIDDTRYQLPGGDPSSRISSEIASQFAGVVIIADAAKVKGYDLAAIADYIAMLALSETAAQTACQPLPTITNLFAADCASRTDRLSRVDLAYLKALYSTDPTLRLEVQQAALVWKMERSLGR